MAGLVLKSLDGDRILEALIDDDNFDTLGEGGRLICFRGRTHEYYDVGGDNRTVYFQEAIMMAIGVTNELEIRINELDRTENRRMQFWYRNHRGETEFRTVDIFDGPWLGKTQWHPEEQWFLRGWDIDKDQFRTFAMKDILSYDPDWNKS